MKTKHDGFTLLEIMIVVFIIGLLATLAVPTFVRARESTQESVCLSNLRIIDTAKTQHVLTTTKIRGDEVDGEDIDPFLAHRKFEDLEEPSGSDYSIEPVGLSPLCNYGGTHTLAAD